MAEEAQRSTTILLVEDDLLDQEAIARALDGREEGWVLRTAGSLAEARDSLRQETPDLILLDYSLPDGTGLELQPALDRVPTVFITGGYSVELAVQAMQAGAFDYLVKDVRRLYVDLLPEVIIRALEAARVQEELRAHREELDRLVKVRTTELEDATARLHAEAIERERLNEELSSAEAKYRSLVETSQGLLFRLDRTGKITFLNPQWERSLGYTVEELLGRELSALLHPDGANQHRSALAGLEEGQTVKDLDVLLVGKSGETVPVLLSATPLVGRFGEAWGVQGTAYDLSDYRRAEEARRISEDRFLSTFEQEAIGIAYLGLDGRVLRANSRFCELLGRPASEILGADVRDRVSPGSRAALQKSLEAASSGGESHHQVEREFAHPDGYTIWVSESLTLSTTTEGVPSYLIYVVLDITGMKAAQAALAESEERFKALFEEAPIPYQSLDGEGKILRCNQAWCDELGYAAEEVLGRNFSEFLSPDYRQVFRESFQKFKAVGYIMGIEFEMIRKDGSEAIVSFNGRIAQDPEGGGPRTHCVFHDVTKERLAQEQLEDARHAMEHGEEIAGTGSWDWEFESGNFFWSKGLYTIYGRDPEEGPPDVEDHLERVHPDDRETLRQAVEEARKGKEAFFAEYRLRRYDNGEERAVRAGGRAILGAGGEALRLVGSVRDITEERVAEERIAWEARLERNLTELAKIMLLSHAPLPELSEAVSECAREITESEHGFVSVVDPETNALVGYNLTPMMGEACTEEGNDVRIELPIGSDGLYPAFWGVTQNERGPFLTNNPGDHPASTGLPPGHLSFRSFIGAPSTFERNLVGMVAVANGTQPYGDRERRAVGRLADLWAAAVGHRRFRDELDRSQERLRSLASRLEELREQERSGTAKDLHDRLGESLTALRLDLASLEIQVADSDPELASRLKDLVGLADSGIETVRTITTRLRSPVLDLLGLAPAVEWQSKEFGASTGIECEIEVPDAAVPVHSDHSIGVFRILQEALSNVRLHAEAGWTKVRLEESSKALILEVEDDGIGISPEALRAFDSPGLEGMRERAKTMGGHVEIDRRPDGGTRVTLRVPTQLPEGRKGLPGAEDPRPGGLPNPGGAAAETA